MSDFSDEIYRQRRRHMRAAQLDRSDHRLAAREKPRVFQRLQATALEAADLLREERARPEIIGPPSRVDGLGISA